MWLVFGLVVVASSSPLYGKIPRLIVKKTSRLTQAVVCFRRYFLSRCKFSTLTSTPLYSSRLYAQNPVFEIVHQESVKVCTTGMLGTTLYAQHPVSRIFPSLPGSRLRCLSPGKFSTLQCTFFLYSPAQIDAACRLEAHYARNKKCLFVLHSTAAPLTTEHEEGVSTCTTRMYSSIFYAQNPALEIVHQQSVNVYLHINNGNVQQNPSRAASCH